MNKMKHQKRDIKPKKKWKRNSRAKNTITEMNSLKVIKVWLLNGAIRE